MKNRIDIKIYEYRRVTNLSGKFGFYGSEHIKYVSFKKIGEIACTEHLLRILAPVPSFSDLYGSPSHRRVSNTQSRPVIAQVALTPSIKLKTKMK